ncbi:MAG: DUF2141 domain-containing protein [Gemmatimonadaceae bacterium]|nr:DUF2141 domain-containing protein [Gemmatimonadaceae bacterium]
MRFFLGLALLGLSATQPHPVRVTVRLVGIRADRGGVMHVALHQAPGTGFPGPAPSANQDVPVREPEATLTFETTAGTYAIAVHHDANANGKLDANFLGIPKEGYGVSRDVRARFRAPRFTEAQVTVQRDTTLVVRLAY